MSAELSGPARPLMASIASGDGSGAPGAKRICVCFARLDGRGADESGGRVCAGGGEAFATRVGGGAEGGDGGAEDDGPNENGTALAPKALVSGDVATVVGGAL